jgi:hypothetical protein
MASRVRMRLQARLIQMTIRQNYDRSTATGRLAKCESNGK